MSSLLQWDGSARRPWVASMTASDISINGSLPAHGPILYDVICICVYTCTCLFYMANGLNKELLNLNLNQFGDQTYIR